MGSPEEFYDSSPIKTESGELTHVYEYKFGETLNPGKPWSRKNMTPDLKLFIDRIALKLVEDKLYKLLKRSTKGTYVPACVSEEQKRKIEWAVSA